MSFTTLNLRGKRVLFAASTGGHLSELSRLAPFLEAHPSSALVTFDSPQSRSLPWIDDVRFVPYVRPRDAIGAARASRTFRRILQTGRWDAVVSTGAAIAVSALPVASALGIRSLYIESYARYHGPSTTGRILRRLPGAYELYTQHESWASSEWRFAGSVLDALAPGSRERSDTVGSYFVTLGTISPYRFDALVDAVLNIIPPGAEVTWQLGCTMRPNLPGSVHSHLERDQFTAAAQNADVVISHAGVGTAIELIEMGHRPLLIPRRAHRGEHVDDHQLEIAGDLAQRGLVLTCDANEMSHALLQAAIV